MLSERSDGLFSLLRLLVVGLLGMWLGAHAAYGKELDQKIIDAYLQAAFADAQQLVKFARVPTVSIYCRDSKCRPLVEKLDKFLEGAVMVKQTEVENSGADIELLFYPTASARKQSKNQYTAAVGEVLASSLHEKCGVVQSRRGFEVVKVIIVAVEDAGPKENLACIMNELLRGAGITVRGRYPEYLPGYLTLDETRFAIALRGIALFLAMQVSPATSPGQDAATVEKALKGNFKISN